MVGFTKRAGVLMAAVVMTLALSGVAMADGKYDLDSAHASYVFKIKHAGVSYTYGMFTESSGKFTIDDKDPSKSSFDVTIKAASINTGNAKRDEHLKGPDFFNTKEFPNITFKSTKVVAGKDGALEVTGDFTMRGTIKPVTLTLKKVGEGEFPPGTKRIGYATETTIKRSDFGIKYGLPNGASDEVDLMISFEGTPAK